MHLRQINIDADAGVPLTQRFSIGGSHTISGPQNGSEMYFGILMIHVIQS
jgi:hypothetical protein